jgi:hypothetical protein
MTVFRQVKNGIIVNRIVADEIPPDYYEAETYELEIEDPPPQIGWVSDGKGGYAPLEPEPLPAEPPVPTPIEAALIEELATTKAAMQDLAIRLEKLEGTKGI